MSDDLTIINNSINLKTAFGSFAVLDDIEEYDHPAIYKFATIVSNYLAMQKKLEEMKKEKA
jgi:hypothetical protein